MYFFCSLESAIPIKIFFDFILYGNCAFYEYCYVNQLAPIWDAGYMQLKNAVAEDSEGKKLLAALKAAHKKMSVKLLKDVIACGMIPEDVQYFDGVPYEEEV